MKKLNIRKYKGFLFDLDGTLIDTANIWGEADLIMLRHFGVVPKETIAAEKDEFIRKNTSSDTYMEWAQYLIDSYNLINTDAREARKLQVEYATSLLKTAKCKESAGEFLIMLKQNGYKLCLTTLSNNQAMNILKNENVNVKEKIDFNKIFENNIITIEMVKNRKPNPECHIKAMEMLNLKPSECLVFEDNLAGALAAKNAGLDVCIVYDKNSDKDRERLLNLTSYHIKSFGELISTKSKQ